MAKKASSEAKAAKPTTKNSDKAKSEIRKTRSEKSASKLKKSSNGRQIPEPPKEKLIDGNKSEVTRSVIGITLLVITVYMLVACVSFMFTSGYDQKMVEAGLWHDAANWAGALGAHLSHGLMGYFGLASFFIHAFAIATSLRLMKVHIRLWKWFINCGILLIWCSAAFDYWLNPTFDLFVVFKSMQSGAGGSHGAWLVNMVRGVAGSVGVFFFLMITGVCYLAYASAETVRMLKTCLTSTGSYVAHKIRNEQNAEADSLANGASASTGTTETNAAVGEAIADGVGGDGNVGTDLPFEVVTGEAGDEEGAHQTDVELAGGEEGADEFGEPTDAEDAGLEQDEATPETSDDAAAPDFTIERSANEEKASSDTVGDEIGQEPFDPKKDLELYQYPTLDLLDKHGSGSISIDTAEQINNKNLIIKVLKDFGVEISTIKATVGPTITLYEIQPAPGVRISKIRNLEDDIALSLAALGIRIIAPIPGKGTVGIEVPNAKPQIVSMESILNSKRFMETDYELPCALGKTITNEVYMIDLAKMPHLLVAGATGQGKSVGLNAIITSLLYKKHPAELKLVMVDPKKVEFSVYQPLVRHFLAQVEDEPEDDAIITDVKKVVATLQSLCAEMDERYNLLKMCRTRNIKEYNAKFKARQLNPEKGHRFLPYIVVIIDEFGDLIMTAGKEVELPIARIAQLARAVGIHMIIATQRPTTNIITGTIKANFPARMAFKVSAMIDSRTILDRPGANQLIGRGDMLFLAGSEPVRVQCAFVDTPEVERIAAHIARQQGYTSSFPLKRVTVDDDDMAVKDVDMKSLDPMFDEVARLVVSSQSGSTSMIQRKLSLGYNRAGRLMDQLEAAGIVGPAQGSKPRDVLIQDEITLERLLNDLHS